MSKVKRILSVIMAMVMVLAMSVPTFAAGENATITLKRFDKRYKRKMKEKQAAAGGAPKDAFDRKEEER